MHITALYRYYTYTIIVYRNSSHKLENTEGVSAVEFSRIVCDSLYLDRLEANKTLLVAIPLCDYIITNFNYSVSIGLKLVHGLNLLLIQAK